VYLFSEGDATQRALLGGKGAGLAEMTRLGLPVPPGFTITTKACVAYLRTGKFPGGMRKQVFEALAAIESLAGRRFGDPANPLLVSVRSGAVFSMPGMMDTVLNLGLNAQGVEGLAALTGDRRFALDAYRRLISLYGRVVKGVAAERPRSPPSTDFGPPEMPARFGWQRHTGAPALFGCDGRPWSRSPRVALSPGAATHG